MKIEYKRNTSIPQGAWCASIHKGDQSVKVEVGKSVFCSEEFFVFGVWDGSLADGDFAEATFSCCSGGSIKDCKHGGVKFSTPTHLFEILFLVKKDDITYVSNSLPFILKRSETKLSSSYLDYQHDLCSSLFGLNRLKKKSPLDNGFELHYFRYCTFEIDLNLNVKEHQYDISLDFETYDQYVNIIKNELQKLKNNATDSLRQVPYGMIATISQGYDATACAALVRDIGCNEAFTFGEPAAYHNDSGAQIALSLGYTQIFEENGDTYLKSKTLDETLSFVTGNPTPGILNVFKNEFMNKLVFLGTRGDSLWERSHDNINSNLDFTAGNTFQQVDHTEIEFSLENNTIFIHLPMICGQQWSRIDKISNSPELKPWSVRDNYDRPIARRILETKGIVRQSFGQIKKGMGKSVHFDTYKRLKTKLSPDAVRSLSAFKKKFKQPKIKALRNRMAFYASEFPVYMNYALSRLGIKPFLKRSNKFISAPLSALLIHWSVQERMKKY